MPLEPNDELTFKLTAIETQHLMNVMQQTYQMSLQIVMKLSAQVQAQMNVVPMRGDGVDVSNTMPTP